MPEGEFYMNQPTEIQYIKAIAGARNISAAAETLGISQPALSAYLKKLENQIGAMLFDRSKKPLSLTETGKAYLQYANQVEALNREFMKQVSDLEELKSGTLTIGGASFFNTTYIPGAVAGFLTEYPCIDVEIIDGTVPEISVAALNGKVDMFITPTAEDTERFFYEKLLDEKIFVAVPPQWKINKVLGQKHGGASDKCMQGGYKRLDAEDFILLEDETFILLHKGQHIGRKMAQLFERHSLKPRHTVLVDQTMTSLALTRAGVGISLITESTIKGSGLADPPCLYLADEDICSREIFAAYPKNKYCSRATSEFIRILKDNNRAAADSIV